VDISEEEREYFDYLDALRKRGVINMFGAATHLESQFGLDRKKAREVLTNWMRGFGTNDSK